MRWVLVVLVVMAMVAAGCSGDDADTASDASSTTTVPSAEVIEGSFTFADDDLCEWVSEDEVAEFVAAEYEWDGNAVFKGASEPDSCVWRLTRTGGDVGGLESGNASTTWEDFDGNPYDFGALEVVDFDEEAGFVEIGATVSGHPLLSDGVVVHNGGFGQFAFWVPPNDEYLALAVGAPWVDFEDYEAGFFGVADRFVQELGWLG